MLASPSFDEEYSLGHHLLLPPKQDKEAWKEAFKSIELKTKQSFVSSYNYHTFDGIR